MRVGMGMFLSILTIRSSYRVNTHFARFPNSSIFILSSLLPIVRNICKFYRVKVMKQLQRKSVFPARLPDFVRAA